MTPAELLLSACRAATVPVTIRVHPRVLMDLQMQMLREGGAPPVPSSPPPDLAPGVAGVIGQATLIVDAAESYDQRGWRVGVPRRPHR